MTVPHAAPVSERDREVLRGFAHRIDSSDAGAHNNLGVLYYTKGLYAEAVDALTKALEIQRQRDGIGESHKLLGMILHEMGAISNDQLIDTLKRMNGSSQALKRI